MLKSFYQNLKIQESEIHNTQYKSININNNNNLNAVQPV